MTHGLRHDPEAAVSVFGSGPEPMLALHPGLANGRSMGLWAEHLGHRLTVTAPDAPGHGRAAWPEDGDFFGSYLTLAHGFLTQRSHLFGHSVGATAALSVALARPEMVRSLILFEPVLFSLPSDLGDPRAEAFHKWITQKGWLAYRHDMERATQVFLEFWDAPIPWQDMTPAQKSEMLRGMPTVIACEDALHKDSFGIGAPGRLEALDIPVFLMTGEKSPKIAPAVAEAMAARLPNPHREIIPGTGHMGPITHGAEIARRIEAFLATLSPE